MKKIALCTLVALSLTACGGDAQEANLKNFKKALERSNAKHSMCVPVVLNIQHHEGFAARANHVVGEPLLIVADHNVKGERINKDVQEQINILTKEGFYKEEKAKDKDGKEKKEAKSKQDKDEPTIRSYQLTEKGQKYAKQTHHGTLFCVGKRQIKQIEWFTMPTPANGVTVSQVAYTISYKMDDWAKKLLKHDYKKDKDGEAKEKPFDQFHQSKEEIATMVQTNKGWIDYRELRSLK